MRRKKKEAKIAGEEENMVLCDYDMPKVIRADSSIIRLVVDTHHFELKPALITLMEMD